ncbi:MAG: glucose-1-phosphate adenylyltransferase [Bacilli bacterium]|nr:glucose-1-phosphate adenylyltransferase [Bacilli bacterium]
MVKKKCVAMILAGGQGSRLGALTQNVAKPAVSFGAKYKIIDFVLSNCTNSGFDTVGILTQYQPLDLNTYVGNGQPWDLDVIDGGAFVLPPYMSAEKGEWYKGTANAIYQNLNFISRFDPEYVLILSGDHIYKMDYSKMLDKHIENNADCTIATITVPWEEASRFGILSSDETGRITEFAEKPKVPKSNQASMGIYIFNWKTLRDELIKDEAKVGSSNDFGKDIIPTMLNNGQRLFIYGFKGYWKDVGTISSLWEANMDLLDENCELDINDPTWPIMARTTASRPHYIDPRASVVNSMITEGCEVNGDVKHSVLFHNVKIGKNSKVTDSIIMNNVVIGDNVIINNAVIGDDAVIENNVRINSKGVDTPEYVNTKICSNGLSLIGTNVRVGKGVKIGKLSMITKNIKGGK